VNHPKGTDPMFSFTSYTWTYRVYRPVYYYTWTCW